MKAGRPNGIGVQADVYHPGDTNLYKGLVLKKEVAHEPDPNLERQFLAFRGGLDRLGSELGLGGDVVHCGRGDPLRGGVEDDAGFGPDCGAPPPPREGTESCTRR